MINVGYDPFHVGPPWWFLVIAGLILTMILIAIIKGIANWMKNNASPILSVPAKVIAKRTRTSGGSGNSSVSTHYYLTFQLENGERQEFHVSGREYGLLIENDTGVLTYQGTRYKKFERKPDMT
ncbi:DUF2500 domain-containing protein [Brevibacillus composti]|uniref:DUF2500 domain-containing protein n=1 Tax=Brevibacillus composti TaxID=2796470 RepID=A0A7T5JQK4_9BACL|nr:DUF2500 domain-containing protein [Brevibacillus composti]QQE76245.1 DUF2500 domain-containing protein [Brevibacillus composti]QUO43273.1 DUF2500 domain-containing protein [Brevibacillus composti]